MTLVSRGILQSAYTPGEASRIHVRLVNNSKGPMNTLRVRLRRIVELHARGHTERLVDDLSSADQDVQLQPTQEFNGDVLLPIPTGIQNSLSGRLVQCRYEISCQGVTEGLPTHCLLDST